MNRAHAGDFRRDPRTRLRYAAAASYAFWLYAFGPGDSAAAGRHRVLAVAAPDLLGLLADAVELGFVGLSAVLLFTGFGAACRPAAG